MESTSQAEPKLTEVVSRIADDVKTIASAEVALARAEIERSTRSALFDAVVVLLSGVVALIGLGMMCVATVVALEPLIEPLWLRLVIMAAVYLGAGTICAGIFAQRLKHDPDVHKSIFEAKRTVKAVREELRA